MKIYTLIAFILFIGVNSLANNPGITYQGRIFKPDGSPLEGASVQFRMQVRSPGSENCLLYEEIQTVNMAASSGIFAVTLNDGSGTRIDSSTYQIDRIFANRDTMTLDTTRCSVGSAYIPNAGDGRKFIVYFKDESMTAYEPLPIMNLNFTPQSMYALEAQKLGPYAATNILRAVDGSGNPIAAPSFDAAQLTNLNNLIAGTSTQYATTATFNTVQTFAKTALPTCAGGEVLKSNGTVLSCVPDSTGGGGGTVTSVTSANNYITIATGTTTPALTLNVGTAVNTVAAGDDSRITGALQSGAAAGGSLTGTYPNPTVAAGVITNTEISNTAAIADTKLATISTAGKVSGSAITSGAIGGSTVINTSGNIQTSGVVRLYDAGPLNSVSLKAPTSVTTSYDLVFPDAKPSVAGYLLSGDTSGNLTWVAPNSGSVTSVTATAPVASTGGATPVISMSQANTTTAGYVSSTDWNTFNDKQSTALAAGNILVGNGSGVATAVAPSSDVSMTNAGVFTVTKIQGSTVSSTTPTTAGQVLRYTGTQWVPNFISMFDLRSTITGAATFASGCTSGQTLTWTSATDNLSCTTIAINDGQITNTVSRTANTFLAAPNGSAGAASYRAIASGDLPSISSGLTGTLPETNGGTGQSSYTVGDLLYASSTTALSKLPASTSGYVLTSTGAGSAPNWASAPAGPISSLIAAGSTNSINNANYAQTWNWNSATSENPMSLTANAITTGSLLSLSTSSASINSTNGLLNVANSTATTTGILARFQANSTVGSGLTILNSGNVGVGTASPSSALHVVGTLTVSEAGTDSVKIGSGNSTAANSAIAIGINNSAGFNTSTTAVGHSNNSNSGGVTFGRGNTTSIGSAVAFGENNSALAAGSAAFGIGVTNSTASSLMIGPSDSSKMTILSSGNVGIGTTSPENLIHVSSDIVNGTTPNGITVRAPANGLAQTWYGASYIGQSNGNSLASPANSSDNAILVRLVGQSYAGGLYRAAGSVDIETDGASTAGAHPGKIVFSTSPVGTFTPVEVMRINSQGNVGIGTTTPNALLDVNGTMRVNQICDSSGANCKTVSGGWSATAGLSALTAATSVATIDNTNYEQTWNWSTATTQSPLSLYANALTTGSLLNLTSSSASLNSTSGLLNVANTSASTTGMVARIQSNSAAGSGLTVLANGNVGIGTTAPSFKLHVASDDYSAAIISNIANILSPPSFIGWRSRGTLATPAIVINGDTLNKVGGNGFDGSLHREGGMIEIAVDGTPGPSDMPGRIVFSTTPDGSIFTAERMRIDSSGNVGVGTSSPSSTLHVVGPNGTAGAANTAFTVTGGMGAAGFAGGSIGLTSGSGNGAGNAGSINLTGGVAGAGASVAGGINLSGGTSGGSGSGGSINIIAGKALSGGNSGTVTVRSGHYDNTVTPSGGAYLTLGASGSVTSASAVLSSGDPHSSNPASTGSLTLKTPNAVAGGSGGNISITAGNGNSASLGGSVSIVAGSGGATNMNGSNVSILGGAKGGTGTDGNILLASTRGNVGIGTASPTSILHIVDASGSSRGVSSTHTGTGGSYNAGIYSIETSTSATGYGIHGEKSGTNGAGVYGESSAQGGSSGVGVYGRSGGLAAGVGVHGAATGVNNTGYGVQAVNNSATGWGLYSSGTSPNYFAGNVGIGTTTPAAKLQVSGQIASTTYNNGALTDFDMSLGNTQYTSASCGAMTMSNIVDGASYTIVVQGATSGTCTFTSAGYTYRFSPANGATTASSHSVYSMQVVGTIIYVSWITGFL